MLTGDHPYVQHDHLPMPGGMRAGLDQALTSTARLRRGFDSLTRRERVLLLVAALALVGMLANFFWFGPAFDAWAAARTRHAAALITLQSADTDLAQRSAAEQQLRSEVAQWRERVAGGERELLNVRATLVSASAMIPMLERLLVQVGGLRLRSMRSLDRVSVSVPLPPVQAGAPAAPANLGVVPLYRHGVDLTVEGTYAEALAYLKAIEAMPQRVFWGGLQLDAENSPKVVMTLRLYTLSEDRSWLQI